MNTAFTEGFDVIDLPRLPGFLREDAGFAIDQTGFLADLFAG